MSNPSSKILLGRKMRSGLESLRRVDEKGSLYYMEYAGSYYGPVSWPVKVLKLMKKGGCSAFQVQTPEGEYLTGRNYDLPHKDAAGKIYGVNLVLRCRPEGKYASISGVDAAWLSVLGLKMQPGCLDDGKTDLTALALAPYLCMDGLNEKGLSVSILALDVKPGEKPVNQKESGKKKVIITMLVRYLLDNCATTNEAVIFAGKYNLVNTFGADYHLFVTDASGCSAVLEWRHNAFSAVFTDAVTNCYAGDDDAADCIYPDGLKEKYVPLEFTPKKPYHFGYGHGYERYKTLIRRLEAKNAVMDPEECRQLLGDTAQNYDGMLTSFTQYSVLYHNTARTADFWVMQDYEHKYSFEI